MKKKSDELKKENQMFKDELSLRKEESHRNSKMLHDLVYSRHKSFYKRGLDLLIEVLF